MTKKGKWKEGLDVGGPSVNDVLWYSYTVQWSYAYHEGECPDDQ